VVAGKGGFSIPAHSPLVFVNQARLPAVRECLIQQQTDAVSGDAFGDFPIQKRIVRDGFEPGITAEQPRAALVFPVELRLQTPHGKRAHVVEIDDFIARQYRPIAGFRPVVGDDVIVDPLVEHAEIEIDGWRRLPKITQFERAVPLWR